MLQKLFIQNYALIDHLELEFDHGLNIVTGETGAGKSILLGALSLVLGNRADTSALLDASRKCIVEARFDGSETSLADFFKKNELDFENPVIIRREISGEGKSRSFVNDTPVNLSQLKELTLMLVDIHSQHETLLLNRSVFQLSVVDAFARHQPLLIQYKNYYQEYRALIAEHASLLSEEKKSKTDLDYFQFQFNELDEAKLFPGETEKLESEFQTLSHAEEIKSILAEAMASIGLSDTGVLNQLTQLNNSIHAATKFHPRLEEIASRIKSSKIELKDIADEMESIAEKINSDPQRTEVINERLNQLYKLQQKHRVNSSEELIRVMQGLEEKLLGITSLDEKINQLEEQIAERKKTVVGLAQQISDNRKKSIPVIENEIKKLLSEVSLPNAILKIENTLLPADEPGADGIDQVKFLFSANKGVAYADISKVASGGELSRLMLCIKSSVAKLVSLPTMIFDEIDTGISGETAMNVGNVLKGMAKKHQLITITHLPQIAGRGEAHYFVYKEVTGKKTYSKVRKLSADERIVEIAKMLSGEKPSAFAIANAKELLKK